MRFRKVVARWDSKRDKGVIKYQIGEIIVTVDNEEMAGAYDAHFWIPGVIDRHVVFSTDEKQSLCKNADFDIAKIIYSRIEKWYPIETLMPKEAEEDEEVMPDMTMEELEEILKKNEKKRERIREVWQRKMDNYKKIAKLWEREVKRKDAEDFLMEIQETEEGLIVLTQHKIKEGTYAQRLYSLQDGKELFQTIPFEKSMTLEEAMIYHYQNVELDRQGKRHWERFVHMRIKNYDELIKEEIKKLDKK